MENLESQFKFQTEKNSSPSENNEDNENGESAISDLKFGSTTVAKMKKKIFNYACWLLARRRYSVSEFRSKLEKKYPEQSELTTEIVENFLIKKYLDDNEYTLLFLREQLNRKPQGLRMIKQKLRQKGINETTISNVFNDQLVDENELIQKALAKKANIKAKSPLQKKQKLFRFLASRGFSSDGIMKALRDFSSDYRDQSGQTELHDEVDPAEQYV